MSLLIPLMLSLAMTTTDAATVGRIHVNDVQTPLGSIDVVLESFSISSPEMRIELDADGHVSASYTPPTLLRGEVIGYPDAFIYLAISERGAIGLLHLSNDAPWMTLAPASGEVNTRGLHKDNVTWQLLRPEASNPPLGVPACGLHTDALSPPPPPMRGVVDIGQPLQLDLAVDTDYEFNRLFGYDDDAAVDYIFALYGAISSVYERDVNTSIRLTYIRVWTQEENLYNDDNPFNAFADYWNTNMGDVPRDLAQLATGRVNLPYGGVASLSATCQNNGYSVAGYLLGSFTSATESSFGNWDVTVAAHELGHNCGTWHTHDYGLDNCAGGDIQRGSIMSYCHTTTGGGANLDMRFHTVTSQAMRMHLIQADCLITDCNFNYIDDAQDIADATSADANADGIPDECQDCNANGVLDSTDIADGTSDDVDSNGTPDECQDDCNANGVPDHVDIATGFSMDAYGNGVPDECETDCDSNGVSDYTQIQADMNLDRNRNALLDACEDCDGDSVPDLEQLAGGLNIWAVGAGESRVTAFHPHTGVPMFTNVIGALTLPRDVLITSSGRVLLTFDDGDGVYELDSTDATLIGSFVAAGDGGLQQVRGMLIEPSSDDLLLSSKGTDQVLRYSGVDGHFIGVFAEVLQPHAMCMHPDGDVLIASDAGTVERYDIGGVHVGTVLNANYPGGYGMVVLDDILLMTDTVNASVQAFVLETGDDLGRWDTGGLESGFWALQQPTTLRIGTSGHVLVATSQGNTALQRYNRTTGLFQRSFYVLNQLSPATTSFDIMPAGDFDCNANMRIDTCDIALGLEQDDNANGIPDSCECQGDLNGDGNVGVDDVLAIIAGWGTDAGDANGDGMTDVDDVLIVLNAWGGC